MPELAEVEWFRKQWDVGHGAEIVDLSLHPRNRIFRSTDVRELRQRLIGEKLLSSRARGKRIDRKSTRLNSSHLVTSYAVCCLKKKMARGDAVRGWAGDLRACGDRPPLGSLRLRSVA